MTLLKLADEIEGIDGEHEHLDALTRAYGLVFGWNRYTDRLVTQDDRSRERRFVKLLDAKAYIDAALTLVPEGCDVITISVYRMAGQRHTAAVGLSSPTHSFDGKAATPALALCAAALKARACDSDRSGEAIETTKIGSTVGESAGRKASPITSPDPSHG